MKNLKKYVLPLLAVISVSAFPALFLYCQNADEVAFSECVPVLLIFLLTGLVLWCLSLAVTRSPDKAAVAAAVLVLVLTNFTFLENGLKFVFPRLKYWHTAPILIVAALHLIWAICRWVKSHILPDIVSVIAIVFGGLIAFNLVTSAPQIIERTRAAKEETDTPAPVAVKEETDATERPNIYFMLFDEYANFPQMEEYYGYENEPLRSFFEENHFNVAYTGTNESVHSETIQANMISLEYLVDDRDSLSERANLRKNGKFFQVLREHGYEVELLESTYTDMYGGTMPGESAATEVEATTINGDTFAALLMRQTMFYPFYIEKEVNFQMVNDYLTIVDYLRENSAPNSSLKFAYFYFPHPPFVVDENGHELKIKVDTYSEDAWENKEYYLGQYKYATKLMISTMEGILSHDPESIIIVMSDHGARGIGLRGQPNFPWDVMSNSLKAVYYMGQPLDIEGLTNLNVLRTVLNELLDMDYEMLALPEGEFDYKGEGEQ